MPNPNDNKDSDKELDPNVLRFGMSKKEVEALANKEKAKKKKPVKKWKPDEH